MNRWFDVYVTRIGGVGSCRLAVVFQNITERRRFEAALRESEARQAFLLKLSDALRAEPSAEAITDRALRMLFSIPIILNLWCSGTELRENSGVDTTA